MFPCDLTSSSLSSGVVAGAQTNEEPDDDSDEPHLGNEQFSDSIRIGFSVALPGVFTVNRDTGDIEMAPEDDDNNDNRKLKYSDQYI